MRAIDVIFETLAHFVKRDDSPPPGIPARIEPRFEREFVSLCEWHSLSPLFVESLGKLALGPVLSDFSCSRLKSLSASSRLRSETVLGDLSVLAEHFDKREVPYLVMDDAVSALSLFADPAIRPVEAISLLVRENDWETIVELCGELGYKRDIRDPDFHSGDDALDYYQYFSPCRLRNKKGTELDLTFRLFDLGDPEPEEAAWRHARKIGGGDIKFKGIGLEDHFLRTCMRLNMTRFERLLFAVDAGVLLSQHGDEIDWAYIEKRARARSFYPAFYCACDRVRSLLGSTTVLGMTSSPGKVRRKMFDMIWHPGRLGLLTGKPPRLHRFRFYFLESGTLPEKLRLVSKIITPRPEWVSAFFGRPYKPWLKIKFIVHTFKHRLGMPVAQGED
jgi:hypothetical protein